MTIQWGMLMTELTGTKKSYEDAAVFVVDLYRCGWSLKDIAEVGFAHQVSVTSVKKLLTQLGVPLRERGGANHVVHVQVSPEDYKNMTYEQLAEKYKCSITTILKLVKSFRCSCGRKKCVGDLCMSTDPHEGDPYP